MIHRLSFPVVVAAVVLLSVLPALWTQAESGGGAGTPPAARALSLVVQKIFVENPTIIKGADPEAWSASAVPRSWRVQRSGDSVNRFDVTYLVRGKPVCVWRTNIDAGTVKPSDCQLEGLEVPPA